MEEYIQIAFQIIGTVGQAKSLVMEGIHAAREGNYILAEEKISESNSFYSEAHHFHQDLVTREANGEELKYSIIFMHAEDQLMSVETITLLAKEIINLYKLSKGSEIFG
ncbi:PTS lactose/cellobiose transporter subunit IIA [Fundicoccus culcitae]|uniref:PTS lactose/cellobiose transporter subunit IIA n=1 Tax=Fundicoccus culcitae TaxID=2969821 RepID=A0ABY5P9C8_9LACT|nr:PTS lactose/cellobiose transporter subunit IIA [Fundicoccus culcitae]UUX35200.1 PTS lactose/cellobiose transporter subunit IIA [Fundicoccus culcitae]